MVPHLRAEIGGAVLGGEGLPPLGAVLGVENNVTLQDAVYQLNAIRGCRPLRALHLFAGAGGSVLAGRLLGWSSVGAVELDPFCCAALERHGEPVLHRDIITFDARPLRGKVDLVVGGFPCQDLSSAGRRAGLRGKRSGLFFHMMRVVDETEAPYIFAENVRGLLSSHKGRDFATVLNEMAKRGFHARWCLLGADDVGAPHQRKRVWIAVRRAHLGYPRCGGRGEGVPVPEPDQPERAGAGLAQSAGDGRAEWRPGSEERAGEGGHVAGRRGGNDVAQPASTPWRRGAAGLGLAGRGRDERPGEPQHVFGAAGEAAGPGPEAERQWRGDTAVHPGAHGGIQGAGHAVEPGLGGAAHGLAQWLDVWPAAYGAWPAYRGQAQYPWEAPRVTQRGMPNRVPRLRALGNGWVPQCAVVAWRLLTTEE